MRKAKKETRQINWSCQIYEDPACGEIVASSSPEVAELIVRCVNQHDALVEALQSVLNIAYCKAERKVR